VFANRFEILRTLGEGGMGVVYEARDTVRDMTVALKTLRTIDANLLYHFKNEFRSHADLHHENLCTLYELFESDGQWFFTMELVEGCDFATWVRGAAPDPALAAGTPLPAAYVAHQTGDSGTMIGVASPLGPVAVPVAAAWNAPRAFDEPRLRDALAQVASGLAALHASGKVHRDIKPGNILVTPAGRVVIMDFGLVADRELLDEVASTKMIAGTPVFMAPEQGDPGAVVGTPADWYAVGVMLFHALTGQWPYGGNTVGELLAAKRLQPRPPARIAPGVPADLSELCARLLAPDPGQRATGHDVLAVARGDAAPVRRSTPRIVGDVFVGRATELAMLKKSLAESRRQAACVFVEGPSGLGKSALVRRFIDDAPGAMVLEGRCYAEESVPYKAFDGIVDALSRNLVTMDRDRARSAVPPQGSLAARLFPVLHRAPGFDGDADTAAAGAAGLELRARAFAALIEVLRRVASEQALVLFVDDLQWADADSLLLMRELLRPEAAPHLLFVASVRTDASNAAEPLKFAPDSVRRLELGRLSVDDAAALVTRLLPEGSASDARRDAIAKEAAGHPLFLAELAHHLAAHGGDVQAMRLDDALWERAQALEVDARRVLQTVAVAAMPTPSRAIADASGLSPTRCAPLMSALRAARFVKIAVIGGAELVEPYHDRVRESVVSRMGADAFAATSGKLAEAMLRAGLGDSAPELVVRHLFAAGDSRRGADFSERAAARAMDTLAYDRAAELLRAAIAAGPRDDAHRRAMQLSLADALAAGGRGAEAADAFLAAGHGADHEIEIDCRRRAADQLLASGHVARGLTELASVLGELGEGVPETPAGALASLEIERDFIDPAIDALDAAHWRSLAPALGDHDVTRGAVSRVAITIPGAAIPPATSGALANATSDILRRLDCYQSTSLGLILVDNVRGADFQARAVRLALDAGDPRRAVRALVFESIYRAQESEAGRARGGAIMDRARELARGRDDAWMEAYLVFGDAFGAYYAGRFRAAVELFKDADARFRAYPGVAWEQTNSRVHRLRAIDYQGAWGELRALYDEYLRDAERRDDRYMAASITRWFNVLWLAQDRPDLAGADLDRSPWQAPDESRYHLQHFLELRARVELALYRGDGARQGHWARPGLKAAEGSLLFRIQIARAISDWLLGRIAACERDTREVELRASRLADDRVNYGAIWSGLLQAAAIAQRHDRAGAIRQLEFTASFADDNEFPLCATIARLRAGQLDDSADGRARVDAALAWMAAQDIRDPLKMAEIFAPGIVVPTRK
jgi:hypothetical protein